MDVKNPSTIFNHTLKKYALIIVGLFLIGLTLAVITKLSTTTLVIGWGMTIGVPILIGVYAGLFAIIGSAQPNDPKKNNKAISFKRLLTWLVLALLAVTILLVGFFIIDAVLRNTSILKGALSGLYCMLMGTIVFILPIGFSLRKSLLQNHNKNLNIKMIFLLLSLLLPKVLNSLEKKFGFRDKLPYETVITKRNAPTNIKHIWRNLQFYEDTGSESAMLFVLGFPKPIRTQGLTKKPGDVTRCIYDRGYLVKQTTHVNISEKSAYLAFNVIKQVNIENKAIVLKNGSFTLNKLEDGLVKIELNTKYKPLMTPRWAWRPLEQATAHALHNHVINKIIEESIASFKLARK